MKGQSVGFCQGFCVNGQYSVVIAIPLTDTRCYSSNWRRHDLSAFLPYLRCVDLRGKPTRPPGGMGTGALSQAIAIVTLSPTSKCGNSFFDGVISGKEFVEPYDLKHTSYFGTQINQFQIAIVVLRMTQNISQGS